MLLSTQALVIGYNHQIIKSNLNLSIERGELVMLIGSNGVGKSTLLRTISNLQTALKGEIFIDNQSLNKYNRIEIAQKISYVSTENIDVGYMTVYELVAMGRFPYTNWLGSLQESDKQIINQSIEMVGMSNLANKEITEISDGERQRAVIARALAQDTDLVILDEPTAFLDIANKYEVVRILHQLAKQSQKAILLSTHDLNIALKEADKIWLMLSDKVHEGSPEDLILNQSIPQIFESEKSRKNIYFDFQKGDFCIRKNKKQKIGLFITENTTLVNSHIYLACTKRALERIEYEVISDNKQEQNINIVTTNKVSWYLDSQYNFDSIYDLIHYLKKV